MRAIPVEEPYDLAGTLFPLRRGTGDPTMRIEGREAWRAAHTPEGAATMRLQHGDGMVAATAWGPGAGWALDRTPGLIGAEDDLSAFEPRDDVMTQVWKEHRGVRLTRALDVVRTLVAAVLEQKVVGLEARRAWRRMTAAVSEPAPGEGDLLLPPDPSRAASLEALTEVPPEEGRRRLQALPGIGPWTASEVMRL
jgi:hypothetical protein